MSKRQRHQSACVASIVALVAASVGAQPSSPREVSIVVAPFGVGGEAPAALAESMRRDLWPSGLSSQIHRPVFDIWAPRIDPR